MKPWRVSIEWATRKGTVGSWLLCVSSGRCSLWIEKTRARQWRCRKWWANGAVGRKWSPGSGLSTLVSTLDPSSLCRTTPCLSLSLSMSPTMAYIRSKKAWFPLLLGLLWHICFECRITAFIFLLLDECLWINGVTTLSSCMVKKFLTRASNLWFSCYFRINSRAGRSPWVHDFFLNISSNHILLTRVNKL